MNSFASLSSSTATLSPTELGAEEHPTKLTSTTTSTSTSTTTATSKQQIIIIGAGIIGVCAALFLTRNPSYDPNLYHITIVESRHPASGTTGKAAGLVGQWAFPQEIVPLSFRLHTELSTEFDGPTNWDYRPLSAFSLEGGLPNSQDYDPYARKEDEKVLPEDLNWINRELVQNWYKLGSPENTFQVNPYKLTHCLLNHLLARDDVTFIKGHVLQINKQAPVEGSQYEPIAESVTYIATDNNDNGFDPNNKEGHKTLYGDKIIVTTGPWVGSLLNNCPVVGLQTKSLIVSQPEDPELKLSSYGLYTDFKIKHTQLISPEFYSRMNDIYIFGESGQELKWDQMPDLLKPSTSTTSTPPPTSSSINHSSSDSSTDRNGLSWTTRDSGYAKIIEYCRQVIPSSVMEKTKVLRTMNGHIPVINSAVCEHLGPFIGQTDIKNIYLAAGHGCWGITNGPATGLLLAEIVLEGEAKSADIKELDPRLYFKT